jgi:NitT/TauT family transport system substrate-binding protein
MPILQSRRRFLAGLSAAGSVGLVPLAGSTAAEAAAGEPALETTRVRLMVNPKVSDCFTPIYASEELLRIEGFTDIEYVLSGGPEFADFDWMFAPQSVRLIAKGAPLTVLSGLHAGCLELIATDSVKSVKDLKGRRVGIDEVNSASHVLIMIMAANIGLDPAKDIEWVPSQGLLDLLARGEIDAFLGIPPDPQMARDRGIGHVILNTALERPWSQYFCCVLFGDSSYVTSYPGATKRALRAFLKAADLCVSDPEIAARRSADRGFASSYDYALQTLSDARYDVWRDFDPADTVRFYSLRLLEAGMIDATPDEIIAKGTDWRFLDELKRELKG